MKRFYKFLMPLVAVVAMLLPAMANAQVTCDSGSPVTVSNADTATSTTGYMPGYSLYNYSFSEVLVPADSIGNIGDIKALQFKPASTSAGSYFTNCEIYLANTTLTDLSAGFLNDASAFELVWSGNMSYTTTDWQTVVFDSPFTWDGTSNIVVAVRRNHGDWTSGSSFVAFNAGATMGRYVYQDSGPYTIGSLPSGNGTSTVAWYKFIGCEGSGDFCYRVRDLAASGITPDGFTLSWTDTTNTGASYTIYDMTDTTVVGSTSSNTYTFTGLNSNTLYHYAVVTECSTGSTSVYARIDVRTACGGYTAVPYSTNFDDVADGEIPSCWLAVMTGTSNSGTFPSVYNYSTNSYSSPKYFEFESSVGATELVALPSMDNISSLSLSFYASVQNQNFVLEVGVLNDTLFEVVDTVNLTTSTNWHDGYNPYTVYFANYSGSGDRIALRVSGTPGSSYTLMMDNFEVNEFSGCYPVSDLTATDIDSTSITLNWNDALNSGVTYEVTYRNAAGDSNTVYATSSPYTVTGLNANTLYSFEVSAVCTDGLATATTGSWRTACGTTTIPYTEGFEGLPTGVAPPCWTVLNGNPRVMTSYPHTGSQHLYFAGAQPNTIVLPTLGQPTGNLQVRFWTRPESYSNSSCGSFAVGYMTDPNVDSTFVQVASWNYNDWTSNSYVEKEVPLTGAPDTAYIVLRHNSAATNWYWFVDDLVVEPIPTCAHPVSVSASNVTSDGADLAIVGTGDQFRVYYNDGYTTDSVDVYDTAYTLTSLNASTQYTITVVTVCPDASLTSGVTTSFRTLCAANGCMVTVAMNDGYGDGWNGAALNGFVNGVSTFSATLSSGSTGTFTYAHCSTDTLSLVWQSGSFDSEIDYTVTIGSIQVVSANGNDFSNGATVFTTVGCPSCGAPHDVTVGAVGADGATMSWAGAGANNFRIYYTDGTTADSVDVTDSTYTFTGLTSSTTYTVTVASICDDATINIANPVQFTTTCAAGGCVMVIDMVDGYGDGWNGNAITVFVNGVNTATATISDGNHNVYTYNICGTDTIALFWTTGSYPDEASFTVTAAGSIMAAGTGDDYSTGDTVAFFIGCPTCPSPTNFVLDSVSVDAAGFHWMAGGSETEWLVTVGDSSFVTTTNHASVSGLTANTYYIVTIAAICGVGDTSMVLSNGFRTSCGAMSIPFTEGFEGMDISQVPTCWTVLNGGVTIDSYNANTGSRYLFFSSGSPNAIALPEMSLPTGQLQVRFWTRPESLYSSCGNFEVGYMTNLNVDSTYVMLASWPYSDWSSLAYVEKEVPMIGAPDSARIVFRQTNNATYYYWYVDDVTVELMPDCPRPGMLTATTVTDNQIDVAFAGSTSGNYIVYITDSVAFSDSAAVVADSTHSFTGLSPLTTYTISIVADCGTSVSPSREITVTTTAVADVLPLNTGFEVGQDTAWMFINGSQTNKWFIDTAANNGGSRALYISNDNGVSNAYDNNSTSNVFVTKLLAFDSIGDYAISYDWRANAESCCDYLRVFLVPGSVELVAGNNGEISTTGAPAGWIALDGGNKLNQSSSWQNYTDVFSLATPGNYNLVFFWHNDGSVGSNPPAAIDNVQLSRLSCPQPQNIVFDAVTDASASFHWTPAGSETEWAVTCNGVTTLVSSSSAVVNGLEPSHSYNVEVRAVCGAGDTSFAVMATFITDMCTNADVAFNWDTTASTTTSNYSPMGYSFYNYGYIQTIIPAANLTDITGDITALAFYPASTSAGSYYTNMDIYLANVSENDLSAGFIHPDSTHTFVQVLNSGDLCYTTTTERLVAFNDAFTWDGHSNILVAVNRRHGSYSSGATFQAHTDSVQRSRYAYTDGSAYNITTVTGGTGLTTVGNLKLISCGTGCQTPVISSAVVTDQTVTINYTGSATGYEVHLVAGNWVEPSAGTPVSANTYTFTGLTSATQYTVGVRAVCDDGLYSQWYTRSVTTEDHPCDVPTGIAASNLGYTSATLTWTPGAADQTQFEVLVTGTNYDTSCAVTGTTLTLDDLTSDVEYSVRVIAICGPQNYSDTSAAYTFRTNKCNVVTGLAATNVTATTATLTWNAASGNAVRYEVEYGEAGFREGNGTTVQANGTTVTLTDLLDDFEYDAYVRVYCTETLYSNWSEKVTFTTTTEGIDEAAAARIGLYPNPASSTVTLTGIDGEATVTVVDMNGREVQTIKHTGSSDVTLDVTGMAQGAYFVRITGERVSAIRKLIVK